MEVICVEACKSCSTKAICNLCDSGFDLTSTCPNVGCDVVNTFEKDWVRDGTRTLIDIGVNNGAVWGIATDFTVWK